MRISLAGHLSKYVGTFRFVVSYPAVFFVYFFPTFLSITIVHTVSPSDRETTQ